MKKCLKILLFLEKIPKDFLKQSIHRHANALSIEGTVQIADATSIKIIACGKKDKIDAFLDILHKELAKLSIEDMQVEPFLKEKEYRGVFRIIE